MSRPLLSVSADLHGPGRPGGPNHAPDRRSPGRKSCPHPCGHIRPGPRGGRHGDGNRRVYPARPEDEFRNPPDRIGSGEKAFGGGVRRKSAQSEFRSSDRPIRIAGFSHRATSGAYSAIFGSACIGRPPKRRPANLNLLVPGRQGITYPAVGFPSRPELCTPETEQGPVPRGTGPCCFVTPLRWRGRPEPADPSGPARSRTPRADPLRGYGNRFPTLPSNARRRQVRPRLAR